MLTVKPSELSSPWMPIYRQPRRKYDFSSDYDLVQDGKETI
jgi:hypothetical protein